MSDVRLEVALGIAGWYLTSFGTLLLNKHLLGSIRIQPNTLAVVQMVSTAIYGACKTLRWRHLLLEGGWREVLPSHHAKANDDSPNPRELDDLENPGKVRMQKRSWRRGFYQMGVVGAMRFATVVLGLVSLQHVAASFTETIKASAPFFTIIIAYLMLREKTSPQVVVSLIPVAMGLVLVSCTELSFNMIGFSAAVATNIIECVQNVFSKRLLAKEYTASQLQFYTSLTALLLQAPIFLAQLHVSHPASPVPSLPAANSTSADGDLLMQDVDVPPWTRSTVALLWIDGVLYHLQSVLAYVVMSYLSPVTVSVVNTLKRALLIWISVLVFGNQVTAYAQFGTIICLLGAVWYNFARQQIGSSNDVAQSVAQRAAANIVKRLWKLNRL